ncbi:MAG TPA: hypothetical protein VF601_24010 [Beijerinckiaceae bacterium]|jgi:hypothetical protein
MTRIVRSLMLSFGLLAAGALAEAPMRDAYAQAGKQQARAKKQKAQRPIPAARATAQPAPTAQARPPAYDPTMRDSGGGGGGY